MAMTNSQGYFCDVPCGMMNSRCENFFRAGCASAGMKLRPNTEYPEYHKVHIMKDGEEDGFIQKTNPGSDQ